MRIAALADIHGNLAAFRAALAHIGRQGVDRIVIVGLQVAFNWRALAPVEQAGAALWQKIAPAAGRLLPATTIPRALGLGLLWGWLPCGLVYSVLLIAASSADVVSGASIMIAFGLGTMPAMIMTGVGALQLARFAGRARLAAGLLIVALGILTLAMPVQGWLLPEAGGHEHMHG